VIKPNKPFGMDIFAKRLKVRAAELGISNAQAARLCGLDERRYANYAANDREPDLATLAKIARTLQVSTDHLLGLTEAVPTDDRGRLLDRLAVSASSLTDDQLGMIVTQVEALAIPRPKKTGKKSPPISGE
jgi:transcriptional regulator with XRE-family HTH domain